MSTNIADAVPRLKRLIPRLRGKPIGVLGDLMLDRYLWGTASRLSPEAAVPVVDFVEQSECLGGSGNVAANIATLGARVEAFGVIGNDEPGRALLRAGTYLGVPKPPFTPGYELVGVVEELGPGCSRLRKGDRIASLTVWGAYAERVCMLETNAVEVLDDLDPAEVVGLVLTYMTAYQLLYRMAMVKSGETVLVHGAAGRVGTRSSSSGR